MEGYIDIHSHIIPKVDDGAESTETALRMLALAYREGVRSMIATPHVSYKKNEGRYRQLKAAFASLQEKSEQELPDLKLYFGSEIYYSQDTVHGLETGEIPTLAGTSYVLVEFTPSCEYRYLKSSLQNLVMSGFKPIIAHVERYYNLNKEIRMLEDLVAMGAYLQSNAMSILGENGREAKKVTKSFLKSGLLHFIATDSHNESSRPPKLEKCLTMTRKRYGEKYAAELFMNNARKLLNDQYI